jgi:arsenite/tail-anchored protein-transporting ATPase
MRSTVAAALARPIVFFGGKGGVGKTTLAAAHALGSAAAGVRTLLVSTDPAHSTADALGVSLGSEPVRVGPALDAIELDAAHEAERYIDAVKDRLRDVASPRLLAEIEREVDAARLSPGAEEAALFERFAALMQLAGDAYDRVVFDTAPTGHTLQLLSLPERMRDWIDAIVVRRRKLNALARLWRNVAGGEHEADPVLAALEQRQARFRAARSRITDASSTAFAFVLTPERLPLLETTRAVATLERYGIPVSAILVNRVMPDEADGAFAARLRTAQQAVLSEIDRAFRHLPVARVPLQAVEPTRDGLRAIAALLA